MTYGQQSGQPLVPTSSNNVMNNSTLLDSTGRPFYNYGGGLYNVIQLQNFGL